MQISEFKCPGTLPMLRLSAGNFLQPCFCEKVFYGLFQSSKTVAFTRGGVLHLISLTLLLYLSENLLQCKAQRGLTVGIKKEPALWAMNL